MQHPPKVRENSGDSREDNQFNAERASQVGDRFHWGRCPLQLMHNTLQAWYHTPRLLKNQLNNLKINLISLFMNVDRDFG